MIHFKQLEFFTEELEHEKKRRRYAAKAAKSLIQKYQIREESELGYILNVANATDNQYALMHWILSNTPETEYVNSEMYAELAAKLRRILLDVEQQTIH